MIRPLFRPLLKPNKRSSLENYTSNNTRQHKYNTRQHQTTRVQHNTTGVQHETTRAQMKRHEYKTT